jgi:hypothetical protein
MSSSFSEIRCPNCNHCDIHKSRNKHLIERVGITLILRKPVRCYDCYHRITVWSFLRVKYKIGLHLREETKFGCRLSRFPTRCFLRPQILHFIEVSNIAQSCFYGCGLIQRQSSRQP